MHLRCNRSFLNSHRYVTGLSNTDLCDNCSQIESTEHFVFTCKRFEAQRKILFDKMETLISNFKSFSRKRQLQILLNGININNIEMDCRNVPITLAFQSYLLSTKRFVKPSS